MANFVLSALASEFTNSRVEFNMRQENEVVHVLARITTLLILMYHLVLIFFLLMNDITIFFSKYLFSAY